MAEVRDNAKNSNVEIRNSFEFRASSFGFIPKLGCGQAPHCILDFNGTPCYLTPNDLESNTTLLQGDPAARLPGDGHRMAHPPELAAARLRLAKELPDK